MKSLVFNMVALTRNMRAQAGVLSIPTMGEIGRNMSGQALSRFKSWVKSNAIGLWIGFIQRMPASCCLTHSCCCPITNPQQWHLLKTSVSSSRCRPTPFFSGRMAHGIVADEKIPVRSLMGAASSKECALSSGSVIQWQFFPELKPSRDTSEF